MCDFFLDIAITICDNVYSEKTNEVDMTTNCVPTENIKKGDYLTKDNIWVKRPGTGEILAEDYNEIIGKRAVSDILNDTHLTWKDIE